MPWNGGDQPGSFPTLGYQVADLIEAKCAIPDGDRMGDPFILTNEMLRFLLWFYRLDPVSGGFVYDRGAQLCRPQKWGKGPFSAAIICAEADPEGPVRPDGWDAAGEPVGRPWVAPEIQVTGITEANAGNIWRALVPMIELGSMSADIPDTGMTRILLPGGGLIQPVTSAALTRLGQRVRFVAQDQTESWWKSNGGRDLADVQRRGLAGMGGRWLETPNAWDPAKDSVAQYTQSEPGVYIDDVDPGEGSIRNKEDRRRILRRVYGDSLKTRENPKGWVISERVDSEIVALLPRDPAQAERWFFNRKRAAADAAFDMAAWNALACGRSATPGVKVTVGVHGSRFGEALAIVATEVVTGFQFVAGAWEEPEYAPDDYEHPHDLVVGAMSETFSRFDVWRVYVAPGLDYLIDRWAGEWGPKRVLLWRSNEPRRAACALRNYRESMIADPGDAETGRPARPAQLSHDGDGLQARHIGNAKRVEVSVKDENNKPMWTIGKDAAVSRSFIAAAWAGCLSWEARGDAVAAGATKPESPAELVCWS